MNWIGDHPLLSLSLGSVIALAAFAVMVYLERRQQQKEYDELIKKYDSKKKPHPSDDTLL